MASTDAHRRRCDKQNTMRKKEDEEDSIKMYPPALFQFSPTYSDWARLTAKDVYSLTQPPEMMGQQAWFNLNNPIRYVRLVGIICGVTPYEEKTIITLDDSSTMLIDCVIIHNKNKTDLDPNSFFPGQRIKAKGEIMRFRNSKEIRLRKVERIEYMDDEVAAWESTFEWKKRYWNKPWRLDEDNARAKLRVKEEKLEEKHLEKSYVGKRRIKEEVSEQKKRKRDEGHVQDKAEVAKKVKVESEELVAATEPSQGQKDGLRFSGRLRSLDTPRATVEPESLVETKKDTQQTATQEQRKGLRFSGRKRGLDTPRPTPKAAPIATPKAISKATPKPTTKSMVKGAPILSHKQSQSQEDKENSSAIEITDSFLDGLDYNIEISMLASQQGQKRNAETSFEYAFTDSIVDALYNDSFSTTITDGQENWSQSGLSSILPDDTTFVGSQTRFTGHRRSKNTPIKRKKEEQTEDTPPSVQVQQNTPKSTVSQRSRRKRARIESSFVSSQAKVDIPNNEQPTQRKFIGRRRTKDSTRPAESLNMTVTKFPSGFSSAREALRKDDIDNIGKSTSTKSTTVDGKLADTESSSPRTEKFIGKRRTPCSSARPMRPSG